MNRKRSRLKNIDEFIKLIDNKNKLKSWSGFVKIFFSMKNIDWIEYTIKNANSSNGIITLELNIKYNTKKGISMFTKKELKEISEFIKDEIQDNLINDLKNELKKDLVKELKNELIKDLLKEMKDEFKKNLIKELKNEFKKDLIKDLKNELKKESITKSKSIKK